MRRWIFVLGILFISSLHALQGPKPNVEEPHLLYFGAGIFNIIQNEKVANFQLEYRSKFYLHRNHITYIRPLLGVMANAKGSTYIYGGLAFDFIFPIGVCFTPSFAPGAYFKGGGMDLGSPLEFRTSLELSYRFKKNRSRLGMMFYHISNAGFGSKNPGAECLMFFYALPLDF